MPASRSITARNRVAALSRSREPDDPDLAAARRDLRAVNLAAHVERVVKTLPPFTDEQRAEISAILRGGGNSQG